MLCTPAFISPFFKKKPDTKMMFTAIWTKKSKKQKKMLQKKVLQFIGAHSKLRMLLFRTGSSVVRTKI